MAKCSTTGFLRYLCHSVFPSLFVELFQLFVDLMKSTNMNSRVKNTSQQVMTKRRASCLFKMLPFGGNQRLDVVFDSQWNLGD